MKVLTIRTMIGLLFSFDSLVFILAQQLLKDKITCRKAEFDSEYDHFVFSFNPDGSFRQNSNRETNCFAVGAFHALYKLNLQLINNSESIPQFTL